MDEDSNTFKTEGMTVLSFWDVDNSEHSILIKAIKC